MKYSIFLVFCITVSFAGYGQDTIKSLELSDALSIAKLQNFSLQSSELDIAIQHKEIVKAGIRPNPIFNIQSIALLDHSYYPNDALFTTGKNRQDWFQLTKKMQLYGVRQEKIELEKQQLGQTIALHNSNLRDVLYDVSIKWIDAWFAQVNKNMAAESVASLDSLIQHKKTDGIETKNKNEYLRLLILDDQYDIISIDAQLDLRNELNDLQFLINSSYIKSVDINDKIDLVDIPSNLDSLISIALRMRSDIAVYKQQVLISEVNQTLQKSNSVPSPEVGFIVNPQNTIPYAGIFITQPLPFLDHNQGEKQKAAIMLQKARVEESGIRTQVMNEVQKAYDAYTIQKMKLIKVEDALALAGVLVADVRHNYIYNKNGYVDLWEAERTWLETKKLFYTTNYEYRKSIIELLHATGLLEQL
jgi:cobalt-zinc-cadmium efflux system outer membrane protein